MKTFNKTSKLSFFDGKLDRKKDLVCISNMRRRLDELYYILLVYFLVTGTLRYNHTGSNRRRVRNNCRSRDVYAKILIHPRAVEKS